MENWAEFLQDCLMRLGLSSSHPGTPLRKVEKVAKKGHQLLCCSIDELPRFIDAAIALEVSYEIAVEQLPLHEWYAATRRAEDFQIGTNVQLGWRDIQSLTNRFLSGWLEGFGLARTTNTDKVLILDFRITGRDAIASGLTRADIPFSHSRS